VSVVWQRRDGRPNDAIIGPANDDLVVFAREIEHLVSAGNRPVRTAGQETGDRDHDDDQRSA
jgi:hypothetical protein